MRTAIPDTLVICALLLAVLGASAFGMTTRSGGTINIPAAETTRDDLAVSGQNVNISGTVVGDLLSIGGQTKISGRVTQDANVAGGSVDVGGIVGDDLRVAGGNVGISAVTTDDALVAGGSVNVSDRARTGGDMFATGGSVQLLGQIGRNLTVSGGTVTIDGPITGNVEANAGTLTLGPRARIGGNLVYSSPSRAKISPRATIGGSTTFKRTEREEERGGFPGFVLWLGGLVAAFIVGSVLLAIVPRFMVTTADHVFSAPWTSLGIGFAVLVIVPVVVVILMITLVGIPLGFILGAAYFIVLYLARVFVGLAVGRWILGRFGRATASPFLALFVGLVVLWILSAIPFLGWIVALFALLIGIGAQVIHRTAFMRELRSEGRA